MAFEGIRRELRELREARPGSRFESGHERHRVDNHVVRLLLICIGAFIAISGAVTFWLPGPQVVLVILGLAIVAAQWRYLARRMDRLEVAARRWHAERWEPYPHKRIAITFAMLAFASVVALLAWIAWRQDWLPAWLPLIS